MGTWETVLASGGMRKEGLVRALLINSADEKWTNTHARSGERELSQEKI